MSVAPISPFTSKACQLANKDLQSVRKEYLFTIPSSALLKVISSLLRDPRDLPLALLLLNISVTTLPAAILLHAYSIQSHAIGVAYLVASYVLYLQASASQAWNTSVQHWVLQAVAAATAAHITTYCRPFGTIYVYSKAITIMIFSSKTVTCQAAGCNLLFAPAVSAPNSTGCCCSPSRGSTGTWHLDCSTITYLMTCKVCCCCCCCFCFSPPEVPADTAFLRASAALQTR